MNSNEELESQLAEQEKRRAIAEQLKNEVPTLAEKLRVMGEELEATKTILELTSKFLDALEPDVLKVNALRVELYRKLSKIAPEVAEASRT